MIERYQPKPAFKSSKKTSAHSYVFEMLKNDIISGIYNAGDKLPTEIELSQTLSISRAATREGLKALEGTGLITTVQGSKGGRFVKNVDSGVIKNGLDLLLQTQKASFEELIEARKAIECLTARMAALNRTEENLTAMSEVLDLAGVDTEEYFSKMILDLHELVALASQNMILYYIVQAMRKLIKKTYARLSLKEHDVVLATRNHQAIYDAIRNKNPDEAGKAMVLDIEAYRKIYLEIVLKQSSDD